MVGTLEKARSAAAALSALCDSAGGQESGRRRCSPRSVQVATARKERDSKAMPVRCTPRPSWASRAIKLCGGLRSPDGPISACPIIGSWAPQRPSGQALDSREVADIVAYLASWRLAAPEGFSHVSGGAKER